MRGTVFSILVFVSWVSSVCLVGCSGKSSSVQSQTRGGADPGSAFQKMYTGKMGALFSWFETAEPAPVTIAKLSAPGQLEYKILVLDQQLSQGQNYPTYGSFPLRKYLLAVLRSAPGSGFLSPIQISTGTFGPSGAPGVNAQTLINSNPDSFRIWVGAKGNGNTYDTADPVYQKFEPYLKPDSQLLKRDGFIIAFDHQNKKDLYIVGKTPAATQIAQYYFLEKFLGVFILGHGRPRLWGGFPQSYDFNIAGEQFEGPLDRVPRLDSIQINPALFEVPEGRSDQIGIMVQNPDYGNRHFSARFGNPMYHFGLAYVGVGTHQIAKYFRKHDDNGVPGEYYNVPEYYSTGVMPSDVNPTPWQPCFSYQGNSAAGILSSAEAAANSVVMELKTKFTDQIYNYSISLGQNDTAPCERDTNLRLPGSSEPLSVLDSTTYAYFKFVNDVIHQVNVLGPSHGLSTERLQRVRYYTLSYGLSSGNLPSGFSVHPQVTSRITIDSSHAHEPAEWDENFDPVNGKIAKTVAHLSSADVYEYMGGGGFLVSRVPRKLWSNIKGKYGLQEDKQLGLYAETYYNFGLDFGKYWIAAKLAWNTQLDIDDLENQYFGALFGSYADPVKGLVHRLEDLWQSQLDYNAAAAVPADSENGRFFSTIVGGEDKDPLSELNQFRNSNFRFMGKPTQLLVLDLEKFRQIVAEFQELRSQIASQGVNDPSFDPESGGDPEYEKQRLLKKIDYFLEPLKLSLFAQERYRLFSRARHKFVTKNLELPEAMHILSKWVELPDLAAQIEKVSTMDFDRGIYTNPPNQLPPVDQATLDLAKEILKTFPNEALIVASKAFITRVTKDQKFCLEKDLRKSIEAEIMGWSGADPGASYVVTDQARTLVRDYALEKGYLFFEPEATSVKLDGVIEDSEWGKPKFDGSLSRVEGSITYRHQSLKISQNGVIPQDFPGHVVFDEHLTVSPVQNNARLWQFEMRIKDQATVPGYGTVNSLLAPFENKTKDPGLENYTAMSIARYSVHAAVFGVIPFRYVNAGIESNSLAREWQTDGALVIHHDKSCRPFVRTAPALDEVVE